MLGAGASGAVGEACKLGAVPPLTTRGAGLADPVLSGPDLSEAVLSEADLSEAVLSVPVLSGAAVLPAADGAEAEGLVAAGTEASSFGVVAGPAPGCDPGKADVVESVGAVAVDGILLGGTGLGTTGAGFVAAESRAGSLVVVLYCVQP